MIKIYTDGSCQNNPGKGGWAAIIIDEHGKRILSGGEENTTNNRMEMMAAIKGLEMVANGSNVLMFSDSQYLVYTMTKGWKKRVNHDLWERLDDLAGKSQIQWKWIRGHDGDPLNEEANFLAGKESGIVNDSIDKITHLDQDGRAAMVDIADKPVTSRESVAAGFVSMSKHTLKLVIEGNVDKGDVISIARYAGIMAAKSTPQLIPLCHTISLDHVSVECVPDVDKSGILITATAKSVARTGVEMEALTAVSMAALTIYDMCKSSDSGIRIESIRLVRKSGGKSGTVIIEPN